MSKSSSFALVVALVAVSAHPGILGAAPAVAPPRAEAVLFDFNDADGAHPNSGVIVGRSETLFGTASDGGGRGAGVVFSIERRAGRTTHRVIHTFGADGDGEVPVGGLIQDRDGNLYGTTAYGGPFAGGVVFTLRRTPGGFVETILYAFRGGHDDGANPSAALVAHNDGHLYGTTSGGGPDNCGTAFELVPGERGYAERVIHAFAGRSDGCTPLGALTVRGDGALVGATSNGGEPDACPGGCGIVFALVPAGATYSERILYRFHGDGDGAHPGAAVTLGPMGRLFGTTATGGRCAMRGGCGTVFALDPSGAGYRETVLHSFVRRLDGLFPLSALTADRDGDLFGTTAKGGGGPGGCPLPNCGTVFRLRPVAGGYAEEVIYRFVSLQRGDYADAPLTLDDEGALLGTTWAAATTTPARSLNYAPKLGPSKDEPGPLAEPGSPEDSSCGALVAAPGGDAGIDVADGLIDVGDCLHAIAALVGFRGVEERQGVVECATSIEHLPLRGIGLTRDDASAEEARHEQRGDGKTAKDGTFHRYVSLKRKTRPHRPTAEHRTSGVCGPPQSFDANATLAGRASAIVNFEERSDERGLGASLLDHEPWGDAGQASVPPGA